MVINRISIQMLKICRPSICRPLEIIFKSCLESRIFPLEWKKANVVPVHKKMTNNIYQTIGRSHFFRYVENYLNVFYITRCLIFLMTNHFISTNQSGFKHGDSCINQLLSITHGLYASFDNKYEVRGVFFVIFKGI